MPGTHALKAVKAARNEPVKRPRRKGSLPTEVVKTISSICVSRSRTTAFAQNTARMKIDARDSSPIDSAML